MRPPLNSVAVPGRVDIEGCSLHLIHFSSPEPKAPVELIGWNLSPRPSFRLSTLSNMNISETSWPIIIKFHKKHHWGRGLTVSGFGPDQIRT